MAREAVGEVKCKYDDQAAEVRKNEKGKLYVYCPECGIHHLNTPAGQNWILNNATMYGAEGKPDPAPKPTLKSAPPADPDPPAPEPTPKPVEEEI